MPKLLLSALAAALCLSSSPSLAQKNPAAARLSAARAQYYTPTANGLNSFHCNVSIDWKDLLTRFGGKEVPDNAPYLLYLKSIHLSVSDDLQGKGGLEWTEPGPPPEGTAEGEGKMRDGMKQMIGGFFQSWNAYMNGSMVPVADPTSTVTADGDGLHLHAVTDQIVLDEHFDKTNTLDLTHVVTPEMDVTAYPTYSSTPDGLIVSSIRSIVKQPPTAPPTEITMSTTYSKVAAFQLPATMRFEIKNVGTFLFNLNACTVKNPTKP
jgi:hypothetical protein